MEAQRDRQAGADERDEAPIPAQLAERADGIVIGHRRRASPERGRDRKHNHGPPFDALAWLARLQDNLALLGAARVTSF